MANLARDNGIGKSTAYDYRDEAIAVLAARKPSLHNALLAAKAAGHTHVIVDGTLIQTDRIDTPGPTAGVDLWWSGKHKHHGGNIQVVSAPDGWPLWTSDVRPAREHDLTAAKADPHLLELIALCVSDGQMSLADLAYEGEPETFKVPFKKPKGGQLTAQPVEVALALECPHAAHRRTRLEPHAPRRRQGTPSAAPIGGNELQHEAGRVRDAGRQPVIDRRSRHRTHPAQIGTNRKVRQQPYRSCLS
jgi:hypothetical protein